MLPGSLETKLQTTSVRVPVEGRDKIETYAAAKVRGCSRPLFLDFLPTALRQLSVDVDDWNVIEARRLRPSFMSLGIRWRSVPSTSTGKRSISELSLALSVWVELGDRQDTHKIAQDLCEFGRLY